MKQIYFQSSLPRSGSTLLQNLMGQNPDFYVTPTSGVLELLYAAREQYSTSPEFKAQDSKTMKNAWLGFCKNGLQGYYSNITDKPYVLDKSRGWGVHYDFLNAFIDNPKIICMVRDIRSIYSSMEKNFRKNPEQSKGIINWSTGQGVNIKARVDNWSTSQPVGLAMNRLEEIINRGWDKNILFIKYENLTTNPNYELSRIYNYLELPAFEHNPNKVDQITQEDDTVYGAYGDHTIQNEIQFKQPDYNQILGVGLSNEIYYSYPWFNNYFNYNN